MAPGERVRDAGMVFESTENIRQADSHAPPAEGAIVELREHRRDGGVIFETTAVLRETEGKKAQPEEAALPRQNRRSRDAGVCFENTESETPAPVQLSRGEKPPPVESERSRDAGLVFQNAGGRQNSGDRAQLEVSTRKDATIGGVLSSMVEFGGAAARFAFGQVSNAVGMLTDPGHAVERLQRSIENASKALTVSLQG